MTNRPLFHAALPAACTLLLLLSGCGADHPQKSPPPQRPAAAPKPAEPPPPPKIWPALVFPTDQNALLAPPSTDVFQPTAAGKLESALYGSARTGSGGSPIFHEGIDIAPLRRDRQGRPLDNVYAVAPGTVAHVNPVAGNSTYGIYVVLTHDDPMGAVYTLYSHLASATVKPGAPVLPGTLIGRMGNTATYAIPFSRAHLHFEVGVILNARFSHWYDAQKLTPSHGRYHGWNLIGLDPLAFLALQRANPSLTFDTFLDATPAAFEWVIRASRLPDYFRRYPSRWRGPAFSGDALTAAFSENGVPLHARAATPAERARLADARAAVLTANPDILGRNGARLVARRADRWELGSAAARHLDLLLY